MGLFFSEINNCYNLRYAEACIKYKKIYVILLKKLMEFNLIKNYKIIKNNIYIYLRYYNNKPIFFFKHYYHKSNFKYYTIDKIRKKYRKSFNLYFTSLGILTFEEMIIKNVGGKLLVSIDFYNKNIL